MGKVIEFFIRPNNIGLHEDFVMKVFSLKEEYHFDTYFFWDGNYDTDNYEVISSNIKSYLLKCNNSIQNLKCNENIFIPIDFSDQYYGVFKVIVLNSVDYLFQYGSVKKIDEVSYCENGDSVKLDIGNSHFDLDFEIKMKSCEVIDSFKLVGYNEYY